MYICSSDTYIGWIDVSDVNIPSRVTFCRVIAAETDQISFSIRMADDFSWSLSLYGHTIPPDSCKLLKELPHLLTTAKLVKTVIQALEQSTICKGNPDQRFLDFALHRDGKFNDHSGKYNHTRYTM